MVSYVFLLQRIRYVPLFFFLHLVCASGRHSTANVRPLNSILVTEGISSMSFFPGFNQN
jgi:hypothetical protein